MWAVLAQMAVSGYNMWQKAEAADDAEDDYERSLHVSKTLAAEQLAVTYNSIQQKSIELGAASKREELKLRIQVRQAEGTAVAQAAAQGVAGKRAELARSQIIRGGGERAMTELEIDAKRAQDALIDRAGAEERAMVNRLINNQPDSPAEFDSTTEMLGFISEGLGAYQDQLGKDAKEDRLIQTGGGDPVQIGRLSPAHTNVNYAGYGPK